MPIGRLLSYSILQSGADTTLWQRQAYKCPCDCIIFDFRVSGDRPGRRCKLFHVAYSSPSQSCEFRKLGVSRQS